MMTIRKLATRFLLAFAAALPLAGGPLSLRAEEPAAAQTPPVKEASLTFEEHIAPIFRAKCIECHGGKSRKSGLDLRRRFTLLEGGDSGPAFVSGQPDESLLWEMAESGEMPPEGKPPLTARELDTLKNWIAQGAPIKGKSESALEEAVAEITAEERQFWSFLPPVKSALPTVRQHEQLRSPIDAFLLAKLEKTGFGFNPTAPKRVLIRRLYFDLLGLPPTPKQIQQFLADQQPDAYERLVDRVLASPRYGERWGRHWLDVAGYADSDGYLQADRLRPEAWRYRDYVIQAFNRDKPFDQFVLQQIAGDELADWRTAEEMTPRLAENLVATGFLRTAPDPTYGNYAEPLECHKVMADTMQIVGSTFLGLTIQCARCHSHKFDPISQADYYRLQAVFLASYDPARWQVSLKRSIPLATEAEVERTTKTNNAIAARTKQLSADVAQWIDRHREKLLHGVLAKEVDPPTRAKVKAALLVDPKKRNAAQKKLVAAHAPTVSLSEKALAEHFPAFQSKLEKLKNVIAAESSLRETIVPVRGLQDLDADPPQAHILVRGDFNKPGKKVKPGIPTVLVPENYHWKLQPGKKTTGRRHALADWLVDPANPLTARVTVNRIWAHHFGRGIVKSLDNFGKLGARPTHPQLLDWLAAEFIAQGWSQKELHRLIVTSRAFRQTSDLRSGLQQVDPENALLGRWSPQRHEGEIVRDTVLHVAGKLNRKMYGRPIAVSQAANSLVTVADTPSGNRASVYVIVRRSQPVTLMELFDTPRMEINCTQRTEATVVTQSLSMLNSKFIEDNAQAAADRILAETVIASAGKEAAADGGEHKAALFTARINLLYEHLFARLPSDSERRFVAEFLDVVSPETSSEKEGWMQLTLVLFNSNEFLFVH